MLLVVLLVTAWAAGLQSAGPAPDAGSTDAIRLGPAAGEDVAAYLARTATVPDPADASPRLALVQFDEALAPAAAATAVAGTTPLQAVVRVPVPRVQTALHRVDLPPAAPDAAFRAALTAAGQEVVPDASGATTGDAGRDRRVLVARSELAALGRPDCACVVAAVVRVDPAALPAVRATAGVRAVDVAPPGTSRARLAVSPLLPDQGPGRPDGPVVGPVPDDGPLLGPFAVPGAPPGG
ncbi:hypothetical protein [Actinomycetospora atypica]|uniref:Uncharacterized protein n=1 Tax=Actinomycetospora atypica TaxID=1290095 RepID=A0ABV9YKE6_9PSEU